MNFKKKNRNKKVQVSSISVFRAMYNRNYRLFFYGQAVSLIGTWMQSIATGWLVFRLTGSPMMLGIAGFAAQIPAFLLSPVAGVLGDRLSRRKILLAAQVLAMVQALTLAAATLSGSVEVWHIIALSVMLGTVNAFEMPTRQAFVVEMVDDMADLPNAIALNSALFNSSRLIGPALAGILVAFAGEGTCFLLNGISYFTAIAALLMMKIKAVPQSSRPFNLREELAEGFLYTFRFTPIRDLLILIAMISLIGMSFPVLMPVFAKDILSGDSHTYGFLVSASGAGALIGTLYLAMRKSVLGLGRVVNIAVCFFGVSLMVFSFSVSMYLSLAVLVGVGFSMTVTAASINTILQTIVDEGKRGRVMSFYVMAFTGAAPIGSLTSGWFSSHYGAPVTIFSAGILALAVGIMFHLRLPSIREMIRPIYREKGIIPEVASAIQTAADLRNPPEC